MIRGARAGVIAVVAAAAVVAASSSTRTEAEETRVESFVPGGVEGQVNVDGLARYEGASPNGTPIDMSSDTYCAQIYGANPVLSRDIEVGAQGGVQGVVVYVRENVPAAAGAAPSEPIVLDQQGCFYRPGVIALRTNQPLIVRNSDDTFHNVHVRARASREFNLAQPFKGLESRRAFAAPEVGIEVSCDVHDWMHGAIAVFDHPFFAVTGADGRFAINGLPPGEYTLRAWHARLGSQTARVTVTAGTPAAATFTFRGS